MSLMSFSEGLGCTGNRRSTDGLGGSLQRGFCGACVLQSVQRSGSVECLEARCPFWESLSIVDIDIKIDFFGKSNDLVGLISEKFSFN